MLPFFYFGWYLRQVPQWLMCSPTSGEKVVGLHFGSFVWVTRHGKTYHVRPLFQGYRAIFISHKVTDFRTGNDSVFIDHPIFPLSFMVSLGFMVVVAILGTMVKLLLE